MASKGKKRKVISFHIVSVKSERVRQHLLKNIVAQQGIHAAAISSSTGSAAISFDPSIVTEDALLAFINRLGYQVGKPDAGRWPVARVSLCALLLALIIVVAEFFTNSAISSFALLGGGAVSFVYGLASSQIARASSLFNGAEAPNKATRLAFFIWRLFGFALIGAVLGLMCMVVSTSSLLEIWVRIVCAVFMIAISIESLNADSLIGGRIRLGIAAGARHLFGRSRRSKEGPSPIGMGLLSAFTPNAPVAIMAFACLASQSFRLSLVYMVCYGMSIAPMLFLANEKAPATSNAQKGFRAIVSFACGLCLIIASAVSIAQFFNSVSGFGNMGVHDVLEIGQVQAAVPEGSVQKVLTKLEAEKYPNISVKAGVPVEWVISASAGELSACNRSMTIPEYGISIILQPGDNVIKFLPEKAGKVRYSCWLGQVYGSITVTE